MNAGYLFWAVRDLQHATALMASVPHDPAELDALNKRLDKARTALTQAKAELQVRALIANRLGYADDYQDLLKDLMVVSQDPHEKTFIWARKQLAAKAQH